MIERPVPVPPADPSPGASEVVRRLSLATAALVVLLAAGAFALSFDLLMRQIRSEVERAVAIEGLADLSARVDRLGAERDRIAGNVLRLEERRATLRGEVAAAARPPGRELLDVANRARADMIAERRARVAQLAGQGATPSEIASAVGVSAKTARRDMAELGLRGVGGRDGDGLAEAA